MDKDVAGISSSEPSVQAHSVEGAPDDRALRPLSGILWIIAYLVVIALPVILLMAAPSEPPSGFWWDFAMGLGFSGLAMLGIQFVLTARFKRLCAPFGIDIIYWFHRWAAIGALLIIVGHYLTLRFFYGSSLGPFNPFTAAPHMTAGRLALFCFIFVGLSSFFRKQLRIEYDHWRILHALLSAAGVGLSIWHVLGVGYLTAPSLKTVLWTFYTLLWLSLLVYVRLLRPWRVLRKPYEVLEIRKERSDSWTIVLKPVGGNSLSFLPGQFAWLSLGFTPFHAKEHPFSFSGSAENRSKLSFTIKELGDFTRTVKDFKAGDRAFVDGPYGVFTTDRTPHAPCFVFIAGGVGIAPIMSILRTLADRQDRRPLLLVFGNSTWERVIFREELEQLRTRLDLRIVYVVESPHDGWIGESGIIIPDLLKCAVTDQFLESTFFVCGPAAMTKSVIKSLHAMNIPLRRIQTEHFEMA